MHENDIAKIIVDAAFKVHKTLGPGLLESVYETVLAHEIEKRGLAVERQKRIPVTYERSVAQITDSLLIACLDFARFTSLSNSAEKCLS